jgi:hypothetical protein
MKASIPACKASITPLIKKRKKKLKKNEKISGFSSRKQQFNITKKQQRIWREKRRFAAAQGIGGVRGPIGDAQTRPNVKLLSRNSRRFSTRPIYPPGF